MLQLGCLIGMWREMVGYDMASALKVRHIVMANCTQYEFNHNKEAITVIYYINTLKKKKKTV